MPFNSETGAMPTAAPVTIPQGEYCFGATSLDGLKIVSLDPRHSDDEQKRICLIFENQFRDMFARRRFEEIRELINSMIESFPGLWRPVQEREDCVIRAFWDEREYREYQRVHPNSPKPVVWGLPSFSRLFYLMGATYSRELRYSLAHICLLNGYEYEPDHPGLWMAKGNLLSWENRFEEALEAFRTAATIRSWTPPTIVARCIHGQGWVLGELKRFTEARDAFVQALEADPDDVEAQRSLQGVLHHLRQLRELEGTAPAAAHLM